MDVGATKRQEAAVPSKTTTREAPKATDRPFQAVLGKGRSKKAVPTPKGGRGSSGEPVPRREAPVPHEAAKGRSPEEPTARATPRERDDLRAEGSEPDPKGARASRVGPSDAELVDPAMRQLAHLAPPVGSTASAAPQVAHETVMRARSLEELLPALVRRIAWAGDKHRGTVRLELGAGAYAGTTVIVHADRGKVRVETFGGGAETERLRARLDARLRGHGLDVESVT